MGCRACASLRAQGVGISSHVGYGGHKAGKHLPREAPLAPSALALLPPTRVMGSTNTFTYPQPVASPTNPHRHSRRTTPTVVTSAIFGVGAPEAILVGVVALVLFGPKGLAQAAKSFGQVVKSVAPTLRELTDISTDLKSTIEDEIGLREIRDELQSTLSPLQNGAGGRRAVDAAMDAAEDPDIEAKRAASMKAAWGDLSPGTAISDTQGEEADMSAGATAAVDELSTEELERIIAARKAAQVEKNESS